MKSLVRPIFTKDIYWENMPVLTSGGEDKNIRGLTDPKQDIFIRILGDGSDINITNDLGVISTSILEDGSYALVFDTELGIQITYSRDFGLTWATSGIIWQKDGRCGLILGQYLFYISSGGICIKRTNISDFSTDKVIAYNKKEGILMTNTELNHQELLNKTTSSLIGTGVIDYQRLSGYITSKGIIKIFYYYNNIATSIESYDSVRWSISSNF